MQSSIGAGLSRRQVFTRVAATGVAPLIVRSEVLGKAAAAAPSNRIMGWFRLSIIQFPN